MSGGNEWGHGHYISDNGFPFVAWVYLLFGGAMLFAVLILMIKVVANTRYRRGNDKNFKKSPLKIALSVLLMPVFGACGIFNILWLMILGFAGLIITFFIVYGIGF